MLNVIKNESIFIPVPSKDVLDAEDGFALAKTVIQPLLNAIVKGPQKIVITIPQDRQLFTEGRNGHTINGSFFAGLFQELLIALRDQYMPDLKYQAARQNLRDIKDTKMEIEDIQKLLFDKPWNTYAPLETLFWERVGFALSLPDRKFFMAKVDTNRHFGGDISEENDNLMFHWIYQVARGLDGVFSHDLKFSVEAMQRTIQKLSAKPATMKAGS